MTVAEKQPSIFGIALKWGLLGGIISILFALYGYITENFGNLLITLAVSLLISIVIIVLAMRDFKNNNYGYMSYGQGIGIGIVTMVIASLMTGLFAIVYTQYIDTSITEKMVDATLEQMTAFGIDESALDEQRDKIIAENTPLKQLTSALTNGIFGGLILSLIISAIMKNSRPEFE